MDDATRQRIHDAAAMIPGVNLAVQAQDRARAAQDAMNRRPDPAVQARQAHDLRVQRLQSMLQNPDLSDEDRAGITDILNHLQANAPAAPAAPAPRRVSPQAAQGRNAFAGMGAQ